MDNREIILTRRELKIYNSLKEEITSHIEIANELLNLDIKTSFIIANVNDIKLSPMFLKEIRKSDFITKIPYEENYFLITAQNNSLKDSFEFISRIESLTRRKYCPTNIEIKYSILAIENPHPISKILFEIIMLYKKLKKDKKEYKKI